MNVIQKIAKARALFEDIKKDVKGYDYKYADLDGIMKAINAGLIEQGLHIYHTFEAKELGSSLYLYVTCHVSDGESELTTTIPLPMNGIEKGRNPAQEMGKILTYGRRYSLSAALCITADEDTDAQSPEQLQKKAQQVAKPAEPRKFIPSEQANQWLEKLLDEMKISQDSRQGIRDLAPGKTVEEIKQLALGVANGAATVPLATGPIKRSPEQAGSSQQQS